MKAVAFSPSLTNVQRNATYVETIDFRGYRLVDNFGDSVNGKDLVRFNNVNAVKQFNNNCRLTVSAVENGPEDPTGRNYTLDIDLKPFTSLDDGTLIYKKTIVKSAAIPAQSSTGTPYS